MLRPHAVTRSSVSSWRFLQLTLHWRTTNVFRKSLFCITYVSHFCFRFYFGTTAFDVTTANTVRTSKHSHWTMRPNTISNINAQLFLFLSLDVEGYHTCAGLQWTGASHRSKANAHLSVSDSRDFQHTQRCGQACDGGKSRRDVTMQSSHNSGSRQSRSAGIV